MEERPPKKTEITLKNIELIRKAEKSIKIIQPYVQNIEELEAELIEAMESRGVSLEIITSRKRD